MKTKVEKEWTFDQPTEEGFYWVEERIGEFQIVKIKKSLFDEKNVTVALFEPGDHINLTHLKGLKWLGPITPPSIEIHKEESDEEKSDS